MFHECAARDLGREQRRAALGVGHKAPLFGRTQTHDDPLAGHGLGEQGVARPGPHHAGALQAIGHAHVLRSLPRAVGDEVDERDPRLGVFVSQAELPEATRRPLAPAGIADPRGQRGVAAQVVGHRFSRRRYLRRFTRFASAKSGVQRQQDDGRGANRPHERADERVERQRVVVPFQLGGVIGVDVQVRNCLRPKLQKVFGRNHVTRLPHQKFRLL